MELKKLHENDADVFIGFAESRIGGRTENQDSYGSKETPFGFLVTVCDGMGGGPGGKTASSIAVQEIIAGVEEGNKDEETANIIIKAIRRANMAIIEAGKQTPALQGMGSTATVLLLSHKSAFVAHVGDSRIYQIHGKRKVFRTFDHSMVFDLVKQGVITEEQARLSAQSNIITRALGVKTDLEVGVEERTYDKGDRFVLCSDGIHGSMPEKEFVKMIANRKSALGAVTDDIATYVDNMGRSNGSNHDNLTIVIVETKINSKKRPTMSKQVKNLLFILAILCFISIMANIFMAVGYVQSNKTITADSIQTILKKDSLQADSIKQLNSTIEKLLRKNK